MRNNKMILGKNCVYRMECKVKELKNDVMLCEENDGVMCVFETELLEKINSSMIATVTEKTRVEKYIPLFEKRNYEILDLNFLQYMESNCTYDPLQYVKSYADIKVLATSIIKVSVKKNDGELDKGAITLLSALIAYVFIIIDNPNFLDVLDLKDKLIIKEEQESGMIETSLDKYFACVARKESNSFAISCWKNFRNLSIDIARNSLSILNETMNQIFTPEFCEMMATKKSVDFRELVNKKTILLISANEENPLLHLFYIQAFKQLFEYAENCEYTSIFQEKDISVILLQSELQIEQLYGVDIAKMIINNCDSYIHFSGVDLKTSKNISLRLSDNYF